MAAATLAVAAAALRSLRRGALVASAVVVAVFGFGRLAPLLAERGLDDRAQLAAWGVAVAVVALVAARAGSWLRPATRALDAVALVLVVLVTVQIVPYELARSGRAPVGLAGTVTAATSTGRARDIWYLVLDRYGSAAAIERRFGITGNDLEPWLRERGFHVPTDSRAAYRATDFSLASTLNMRYLDALTATIGPASDDRTPARALLRDHEVGRFLTERGYRYYHVGSWFGPTSSNPLADENLSFGSTSEFETVLRETTVLPALERLLGSEPAEPTFRDRHREAALFQLRQLRRLEAAPGPKLVFAHVLLPHDPYVLHADGTRIGEDEARRTEEADLYQGHLAFLNRELKAVLEPLLAGPEATDPIVIVQADEGPLGCRSVDCPSMSPDYLAVRFGVLNALYLPGSDVVPPDTFTSVNTFRLVFRAYFGADLELLPDHSYSWPDNEHLYDFREVTDMLPPH